MTHRRTTTALVFSLLLCLSMGCGASTQSQTNSIGSSGKSDDSSEFSSEENNELTGAVTHKTRKIPTDVDSLGQSIHAVANGIASNDRGEVVRQSSRKSTPWVFVFEETHDSRAGQIEIALMLNQLQAEFGLRSIALEGFIQGTQADTSWFHNSSLEGVGRNHVRVASRLLSEGEISAAEFISLLFPSVQIHPVENSSDYDVDVAGNGSIIYLFQIALRSDGAEKLDLQKVERLQNSEDAKELLEYVVSVDKWCNNVYKKLTDASSFMQLEETLQLIDEIEQKALAVGYQPDEDTAAMMKGFKSFLRARDNASRTMVAATAGLAAESGDSPIAMIIGAAHTDQVCRELDVHALTYAVIRPVSLDGSNSASGRMVFQALNRKRDLKSVDVNKIGAWLDGRIKPQPIVSKKWFQAKSEMYLLTDLVAESAVARGGNPPFGLTEAELDIGLARVDRSTIELDDDDVSFRIFVFKGKRDERRPGDTEDEEKWDAYWCRAKFVGSDPLPQSLSRDIDVSKEAERELSDWLAAVRSEPKTSRGDGGPRDPTNRSRSEDPEGAQRTNVTPRAHVSSKTIAVFATSKDALADVQIAR